MSSNNGKVSPTDSLEISVLGTTYLHVSQAAAMLRCSPTSLVAEGKHANELAATLGPVKLIVNGHKRLYFAKKLVEAEVRRRPMPVTVNPEAPSPRSPERYTGSVYTTLKTIEKDLTVFMLDVRSRLAAIEDVLTTPSTTDAVSEGRTDAGADGNGGW